MGLVEKIGGMRINIMPFGSIQSSMLPIVAVDHERWFSYKT
jgi:hypothetical protein